MKTRLTPPEIRDYRAHTREETLPARSLQQRVRKKLAQHAIKRLFSAIFRSLGELFRAHARIKASQGEFAHRTQRPGDAETNTTTAHPQQGTTETAITSAHPQQGTTETAITSAHPQHGTTETAITSAPKNRTKNAHFSPAKAMAVSDKRAAWPTGSGCGARGRWRGLAGRPVGGQCYKRRQTNAIQIASRGPLLQTSSIQAKKPPFSAKKPSD